MYDVIIIGGGASGLSAGIIAKERGKSVLILESANRVGKKLLATGNGKCNLANMNICNQNYNNPYVAHFIDKTQKFYDFWQKLGLKIKQVEDRIYPYSDSATTVLNLLRGNFLPSEIKTGFNVESIQKKDGIFLINDTILAKNVILATGSNATLGQNSHHLAQNFGHKVTELRPSIAPLLTDTTFIKNLANLRAKVKVSLVCGDKIVAKQMGEILFKSNGISGICIFMLSSYIARNQGEYKVLVDFAPDLSLSQVQEFLQKHSIFGLFQKPICQSIIKQAENTGHDLATTVKNFVIENAMLGPVKFAQVVHGGLDTNEFDTTLQSKLVSNFYACGEVLNVDGDCGGYNLFWAFISGITAGENVC